jgi:hypothetical protein
MAASRVEKPKAGLSSGNDGGFDLSVDLLGAGEKQIGWHRPKYERALARWVLRLHRFVFD